jgi:hypothetical protein
MRDHRPSPPRGVIHPSIDELVKLIGAHKSDAPAAETERLRETCRGKLRAYKIDAYLKRYATPEEQAAARTRWGIVAEFAERAIRR